jgi:hypothetical protein
VAVISSIRQHTSAYVSIRQHTSAYVSIRATHACQHTSAYVSIRQHTSAYVSIRQHTSAYVSIRATHACLLTSLCMCPQATSVLRIRQHTSAYVSIRATHACLLTSLCMCPQATSVLHGLGLLVYAAYKCSPQNNNTINLFLGFKTDKYCLFVSRLSDGKSETLFNAELLLVHLEHLLQHCMHSLFARCSLCALGEVITS